MTYPLRGNIPDPIHGRNAMVLPGFSHFKQRNNSQVPAEPVILEFRKAKLYPPEA
jgi:hypothetical protein